MVKPGGAGTADIHGRSDSYRFKALQYFNALGIILLIVPIRIIYIIGVHDLILLI
jgi:hypothetical protein